MRVIRINATNLSFEEKKQIALRNLRNAGIKTKELFTNNFGDFLVYGESEGPGATTSLTQSKPQRPIQDGQPKPATGTTNKKP